jgi:hypothetical protein
MLIRKSFYWLKLLPENPNLGVFVTDITPAQTRPGTDAHPPIRQLVLPDWFPRKTYLCHIWTGYGLANPADGAGLELYVLHDPKGVEWLAGNPPGSEDDPALTKNAAVAYQFKPAYFEDFNEFNLNYPVLFNRDAGDKLFVGFWGTNAISWLWIEFGFLQEDGNTSPPEAVGATW